MSEWRTKLANTNKEPFDCKAEMAKQRRVVGKDIALKNDKGSAVIRICEDDSIGIFANKGLGIRLNPMNDSITFYGDKVNFMTDETNIYTTNLLGFRWNALPFNIASTLPGMPALLPPVDLHKRIVDSLKDIAQDLLNINN